MLVGIYGNAYSYIATMQHTKLSYILCKKLQTPIILYGYIETSCSMIPVYLSLGVPLFISEMSLWNGISFGTKHPVPWPEVCKLIEVHSQVCVVPEMVSTHCQSWYTYPWVMVRNTLSQTKSINQCNNTLQLATPLELG